MEKQTYLPRKDTSVAKSMVPSVKSNEARTEIEEAARRSIVGKSDVGQNEEQGRKVNWKSKLQWECVCWSLSILRGLMFVFQRQVDGYTLLIRRGWVTISQYSAVQSYLLLCYWYMPLWLYTASSLNLPPKGSHYLGHPTPPLIPSELSTLQGWYLLQHPSTGVTCQPGPL